MDQTTQAAWLEFGGGKILDAVNAIEIAMPELAAVPEGLDLAEEAEERKADYEAGCHGSKPPESGRPVMEEE
jgi:hypothetical protein